jgi:hypothetical protein
MLSGQAARSLHRGIRVDIAEDVRVEEPQRQQFTFLYRIAATPFVTACTDPVLVAVGDQIMGNTLP